MNPWIITKKFIKFLLWIFFRIKIQEGDYPRHEQRKEEFLDKAKKLKKGKK